jgi:hypothetical protein
VVPPTPEVVAVRVIEVPAETELAEAVNVRGGCAFRLVSEKLAAALPLEAVTE